MKEIKFMVWDKENKEFLELGGETFLTYDGEKLQVLEGNENYATEYKDIEILQYTGLKDKNGKEIYEGYIIQGLNTWPFEVLIKRGHTRIKWKDYDKQINEEYLLQSYINSDELEVAGNIYQNPELLEAK